jgi:hypothetical protein
MNWIRDIEKAPAEGNQTHARLYGKKASPPREAFPFARKESECSRSLNPAREPRRTVA